MNFLGFRRFCRNMKLIIFTVTLTVLYICAAQECKKRPDSNCACESGNFVLDLSKLKKSQFVNVKAKEDKYSYSYSPCEGFSDGDCKEVAVCQKTEGNNYSLGKPSSVTYHGDPHKGNVMFRYNDTTDGTNRFFVFVLIYVIGGMLFLRFVRGAKGYEQIPNYDFWLEFPAYVRDGVQFTLNGCKTEATYEQI